ncbi:MAG: WD40 repeat domain-containing protein [Planctomycetes bacterium]|nr:WD40 repeat domain-containing protein [Planctomycetota bacterium]
MIRGLVAVMALAIIGAAAVSAEEPAPKGQLQRLEFPSGVGDIQFSPDGKVLAATGFDRTLRLYEVATGKQVEVFEGHTGRVTCVAWSPDGRTLISGSDDNSIRIWDVQTGKATGALSDVHGQGSHGTGTTSLGWFPDGKAFFSTGYDPLMRIWNTQTHEEIRNIRGHDDCVFAILSPDGKLLASASQDGTARLWDAATGELLGDLEIQPRIDATNPHLGVPAFSPDGSRLFSGAGDGKVRSWTIPGRKPGAGWDAHKGFLGCVEVSPDGGLLVSSGMHPQGGIGAPDGTWDNAIRFWDIATGKLLVELNGHRMSVSRCRISADGTRLATSSWDGTIVIWDLVALDLCGQNAAGEDAESLWKRLGEAAGPRSWAGIRAAVADPAKALAMIGERLAPAANDPEFSRKVAALIRDLDDDKFSVREQALKDLVQLGPRAELAVRRALESPPSPEVQMRARVILEEGAAWRPETEEERRWVNAVKVLEEIGGEKAREILEKLGGGDPDSALTALARRGVEKGK